MGICNELYIGKSDGESCAEFYAGPSFYDLDKSKFGCQNVSNDCPGTDPMSLDDDNPHIMSFTHMSIHRIQPVESST